MSMPPGRRALLDRAWRLSLATPAATVLESLAALGFGAAARSTRAPRLRLGGARGLVNCDNSAARE